MTGVCSPTQVSFELLLPWPREYWDCRHELPCSPKRVAFYTNPEGSLFRGSRFRNLVFELGLSRMSWNEAHIHGWNAQGLSEISTCVHMCMFVCTYIHGCVPTHLSPTPHFFQFPVDDAYCSSSGSHCFPQVPSPVPSPSSPFPSPLGFPLVLF